MSLRAVARSAVRSMFERTGHKRRRDAGRNLIIHGRRPPEARSNPELVIAKSFFRFIIIPQDLGWQY